MYPIEHPFISYSHVFQKMSGLFPAGREVNLYVDKKELGRKFTVSDE
jgi:hypothetical protein